jgi:hypothetical protein
MSANLFLIDRVNALEQRVLEQDVKINILIKKLEDHLASFNRLGPIKSNIDPSFLVDFSALVTIGMVSDIE